MANVEYLKILEQGKDAWNKWRINRSVAFPDLSDASLTNRLLRGLNLKGVILSGADLSGSQIINTNLEHARLEYTNLSGAYITGANFYWTHFEETNFQQAEMARNNFLHIDFRNATGLDTVIHSGPSEISISTIYRSEGKIPEVFLRGCGIPENFITYMHSLTTSVLDFYSCFISYSHADKSFARRLHDALQGRGIRCWLDEHQMLPGDDIFEQVDTGIKLWDKVLLCCSKDSLTSWWVDDEITRAFSKEQQLMKQRNK